MNAGRERIVTAGFEYVARLDADDGSLPGRFGAQIAFLDANPDHAVVGSHVEVMDEAGRSLYRFTPPVEDNSLLLWFRYENALREAVFYIDDYPGSEDYQLWLRLARSWKLASLEYVHLQEERTPISTTGRHLKLSLCRLRIQLDHFEPGSIQAYLGLARSLAALLLGHGAVIRLRRLPAGHNMISQSGPRAGRFAGCG